MKIRREQLMRITFSHKKNQPIFEQRHRISFESVLELMLNCRKNPVSISNMRTRTMRLRVANLRGPDEL